MEKVNITNCEGCGRDHFKPVPAVYYTCCPDAEYTKEAICADMAQLQYAYGIQNTGMLKVQRTDGIVVTKSNALTLMELAYEHDAGWVDWGSNRYPKVLLTVSEHKRLIEGEWIEEGGSVETSKLSQKRGGENCNHRYTYEDIFTGKRICNKCNKEIE